MRARRIRPQLLPSQDMAERLEAECCGARSAILADALAAWPDRQAASEFENRVDLRLDGVSTALGRSEPGGHALPVPLARFIRFGLMINASLPDGERAARAVGCDRANGFLVRVGEALARGNRTLALSAPRPAMANRIENQS